MKKIISIIFLSLLVMKIGGYFAFLTIQQNIFREEAKERILHLLPTSKLTVLSFSDKQFNEIDWKEIDKEFYLNGTLYDVVKTKIDGTNQVIYCISDEKETEIYSEILQMSKTQKDELPIKNNMISLLNLLTLKYTIPQIFHFKSTSIREVQKPTFAQLSSHYLSIPIPLFFPPPEV